MLGRAGLARVRGADSGLRRVLALCARPELDEAGRRQLAEAAARLDGRDWGGLPPAAEAHGLGPLVHRQLAMAGAAPPRAVGRALHGLYLRHREANRLRLGALVEILDALAAAGVPALVLKGAALANLVYPEPGLRPMGDLDLLVAPGHLPRAREALARRGFVAPVAGTDLSPEKHAVLARATAGFQVNVELHLGAAALAPGPGPSLEELLASPRPFPLGGGVAPTLALEPLLWHLCRHLVRHADVFTPLRLIWVADVVALAERFAGEIDWGRVRARYPIALRVLALLDAVVPLAPALRERVPCVAAAGRPGPWGDFRGWPRVALLGRHCPSAGRAALLRETLCPPGWWLRLHYGLDATHPLVWYSCVRHPLEILGLAARHLLETRGARAAARPDPLAG